MIDKQSAFSTRPGYMMGLRKQREINLISNYMLLSFSPGEICVKQYSVKFEPEIASDNGPLKKLILRGIGKDLKKHFHPFITSEDTIFSTKSIAEQVEITYDSNGGQVNLPYKITIEKTKNEINLSNIQTNDSFSIKIKNFIEVILKNIISANNGIVRFNKSHYYDYFNVTQLPDTGKKKIEIIFYF